MSDQLARLRDRFLVGDRALSVLMSTLHMNMTSPSPAGAMFNEGIAMALAARLASHDRSGATPLAGGLPAAKMSAIKDYVHDNLADNISLQALAEAAGVSRFHLVRAFKAAEGLTPFQYIAQLRMERARQCCCAITAP